MPRPKQISHLGGIYCITCNANQNRYIGSTVNFSARRHGHFRSLEKGTHYSKKLQADWDVFGEVAFAFGIVEYEYNLKKLIDKEQYYLGELKPEYNSNPKAESLRLSRHRYILKGKCISKTEPESFSVACAEASIKYTASPIVIRTAVFSALSMGCYNVSDSELLRMADEAGRLSGQGESVYMVCLGIIFQLKYYRNQSASIQGGAS